MSESEPPSEPVSGAAQPDPWESVPRPASAVPQPGYPGAPPMPPYYYPYPPVPIRRTNGLAIASLVCGICGFVYLIPAILGIVFGCVALRQIKRDGTDGRGMAIAGLSVGSAWLAFVALIIVIVVAGH